MWKLAEDTLAGSDLDALADWLRTHPHLTQGEQVRAFEQAWASWLGAGEAVFVSSGTTANFALVACAARRVRHKPVRIGVAAVTWSTNISPSLLLGHEVRVFDINPRTLGIDSEQACEAMQRGELDILFVTHLLGFNALTDDMVSTAARHGVLLLEDACEAHGARHKAQRVGSVGLGGTFSFYFGHHMSTIEGGMICTADADLADDLRLMRAHGLARESRRFDAHAKAHPTIDRRFLFLVPGLNFRSTELNAFLGLRQLAQLDERVQLRNRAMQHFLARVPAPLWSDFATEGMSSFALPLIVREAKDAPAVLQAVTRLGVESRPVVAGNLLRQPMLRDFAVKTPQGGTPVADHVHACGLYVGNGHHVTPAMVDRLVGALASP